MQIGIPKETHPGENRVPIIPDTVKKLCQLGAEVLIEEGLGLGSGFRDKEYTEAGANISPDRTALFSNSDILLRLRKPDLSEVALMKSGCIHISYLDPFNEQELVQALKERGVTSLSMEMIPRSTRSQKMDALSSQANLAGYVMVLLAAAHLPRIFPMMMTPAGTLKPAKVFIIGAGVAGLQAIATAKRLGAKVTAFDTRPVVAEQVKSLGANFLDIDLGETGQTVDGYAKELTAEQIQMQREAQKAVIAESDVLITTAQVFGRKPPVIVTRDMVEGMQIGSVVVDMAAETGGNVEGSVPNETVLINGVTVIGKGNLPNEVSRDASQMYSTNLFNLIEDNWDKTSATFNINFEHDILPGCIITHGGEITNETIKEILQGSN
ncbi:MAG: Re/Si-specific NAD(P)(+) transhydrogenase subunit alpha [Gammaproteobacteria bacterium]|jgi:NAD(P) transhydrogenase subunit alpha|nr:NAD(P)(+) transhydrogenase (Re/Si-specific) subunit alpha [Gammaproteobacteria bacterium]MCH2344098.1 Re/Si-specific NAD(P)(+) transhydrogenase subunit alpha [Pseudomonadales bacterium]MEC9218506.1 Re/Si-specific NAD(P)(+) transhydrogenase subunit alpha [Pseudomonadota bacterium]MCS5579496.1 Re/Si-specific NAD(P)(+) transhydrogenase subunit alpha [Gammaproteobacteria bacterium]MEC9222989.1 Re/Si-specific NAD(P)(+) transhydrogenase subunit alpha [Pseudomonadota bacterium]|tara:strand:- start:1257 stop:2399 length:1143 start_codon:yes stop_codon:yes gene_type:complete